MMNIRILFSFLIFLIFLNEFISAEEIMVKPLSYDYMDIPDGIKVKKGDYVTYSDSIPPNVDELEWLSRFEIVHSGSLEEPLSIEDIDYLRDNGVKIIMADDWLPADYYYLDGNNTFFMQWVYNNRYNVTLNPDGPFPHTEENNWDWMREYYFDYTVDTLVKHRVEYMVGKLIEYGYNGIFFDWGNSLFLDDKGYESIKETYTSRHPGIPYSEAAAGFLVKLREGYPELVIENNQGFREAEYYLPILDYDMTESYITTDRYYGKIIYVDGYGWIEVPQTVYYPVSENEFKGSLEDTMYYIDYLSDLRINYSGEYFKKTVYMNYAAPDFIYIGRKNGHNIYKPVIPRNAIYYGYAVAKLVDQIEYTEVPWNHSYEKCDVYFYDLGEPLGDTYKKIDNGYIRYYSNGFVIVGDWSEEKNIHLKSRYIPSNTSIYDTFEETWITTGDREVNITIKPCFDSLTERMAPSGRIYIYSVNKSLYNTIIKPENGKLYFMDEEITSIPSYIPIIIGWITVEVETNGESVEFYIDDTLRYRDDKPPFQWVLDEKLFGLHEIKTVVYDTKKIDDKINILIFNI